MTSLVASGFNEPDLKGLFRGAEPVFSLLCLAIKRGSGGGGEASSRVFSSSPFSIHHYAERARPWPSFYGGDSIFLSSESCGG